LGADVIPIDATPRRPASREVPAKEESDRAGKVEPNKAMAARHLALLAPGETKFSFQTFTDRKLLRTKRAEEQKLENERAANENRKARKLPDPLARSFHGTLEQRWRELVSLNQQGAGIFVTFNKTDLKGRKAENIIAIRGVFQEADEEFKGELPLAPTFGVVTSPGRCHVYFLADEPWPADAKGQDADFARMMERMTTDFGGDENAKDTARVLRLAGLHHMKGEPSLVELVKCEGAPRYSRARLLEAFPPVAKEGKAQGEATTGRSEFDIRRANDDGSRPYSHRAELELRSALQYVRSDGYNDWIKLALALKRLGWDDDLAFELFREVSQRSKGYAGEADCRAKWEQPHSGRQGGVTVAYFYREAKDSGWVGLASTVFTQEDYERMAADPEADGVDRANIEFALIENPVSIFRLKEQQLLDEKKFRLLTKNRFITRKTTGANGEAGDEVKNFADAFLSSKKRRQHKALVFTPGQSRVTFDNSLNLYKGFTVQPNSGLVEHFELLLWHVVNNDNVCAKYLTQWFAHLFQYPNIKMKTAPFIVSRMTGIGKSLLIERIGSLMGEYFKPVGSNEIKGSFNAYLAKSLLIYVDEMLIGGKKEVAEFLKTVVTQENVRVNDKFVPVYDIRTYANLIITSQHTDGIYIADKDRRYFAIRSSEKRLADKFYAEFVKWWDEGGNAHVLHYLLNYDLRGFNPHAPAPETAFKRQLIEDGQTEIQRRVAELQEEYRTRPLQYDIDRLFVGRCIDDHDQHRMLPAARRELRSAGSDTRQIRVSRTPELKVRLWSVSNFEKWRDASDKEWAIQFLAQEIGKKWLAAAAAKKQQQ